MIFKDKVTIIIPIYNAEKYLKKTINSVINQDYKNIELLLINDGSNDNSLDICENFAKKDLRIKIFSQKNLGVSSARNLGIYNSTGNYIMFVDADDIMEKDIVSHLLSLIYRFNCDVACCNTKIYEKNGEISCSYNKKTIVTYNSNELLKLFLLGKISHACWDKIYKKNIFDKIIFPLNTTGEDRYFCWNIYKNINKIVFTPKIGYNYIRKKSNSITSAKLSIKNLSRIEEALSVKNDVYLHFPYLKKEWEYYYFIGLDNLFNKFVEVNINNDSELYKYFEYIIREINNLINLDNFYIRKYIKSNKIKKEKYDLKI